ncbi:MAG: uracil-DNA glycosylase [Christensenellaceae bacterium]
MLDKLYAKIQSFYETDGLVFGDGKRNADFMLIGEAPGKDEVLQKKAFVGKAGKNLADFLEVLGLCRQELFITNVCKFRPFKVSEKNTVSNRPPTKKEIVEAMDFLHEEVALVSPKMLVTLGNTPLRAVTGDFSATVGDFHGKATKVTVLGIEYPLFALYHPASIIYNRSLKEVYEQDLRALKEMI